MPRKKAFAMHILTFYSIICSQTVLLLFSLGDFGSSIEMAANTTEQQLQDIDSSVVMFPEGALKIANTVKGICTFAREGI